MCAQQTDRVATHLVGDDGPLVVFLHGLFGQGKNFATAAKALTPAYRSLLVDLPNHGKSAWTDGVDYVQMADAVAATVGEVAGGEPVTVVGHSMGGKVAMVLALRHPTLVERLAVVDISPVATDGMSEFSDLLAALATIDLAQLDSRGEADAALRERITNQGTRGFLLQNLQHRDGAWHWRANLDLLRRDLGNIGGFPDQIGDARYDGPVLWIAGADSPYVRAEHSEAMRSLFPRVRKLTIKGAGHWVHSEQPAVFTEALRRFLGDSA